MEDENQSPPRRRNIGFAASWAAGICFVCIVVGQAAEQFASLSPGVETTQTATGEAGSRFNVIDYDATGAIKSRSVVLSPCGPTPNGQ
jgi:hypothetical protein